MKRYPIVILLLAALGLPGAVSSCHHSNDTDEDVEWLQKNLTWYAEMQARTNADGTPFYTELNPDFYKSSGVLIHYFNDRSLTADNLSPLETSTVNVRYIGHLYNDEPFDSSYLNNDGIAQFKVNGVIDGWQIALNDMHVGDTAEVIIPFLQAYGADGSSSIPPYSYLRFNLRLVDIPAYEINP